MIVCEKGWERCVCVLIEAGADINLRNDFGATALFRAVIFDNIKYAECLIKAGTDVNISTQPPLLYALNKISTLDLLLKSGANRNVFDHFATPVLHLTAMTGNAESSSLLIPAGADVNHTEKWDGGKSTLQKAVEYGKNADSVNVLINGGANVNYKDINGCASLITAARRGQMDSMNLLIRAGANVNLTDKQGQTQLINCEISKSVECIRLLLRAGANINVTNYQNHNALQYLLNTFDDQRMAPRSTVRMKTTKSF